MQENDTEPYEVLLALPPNKAAFDLLVEMGFAPEELTNSVRLQHTTDQGVYAVSHFIGLREVGAVLASQCKTPREIEREFNRFQYELLDAEITERREVTLYLVGSEEDLAAMPAAVRYAIEGNEQCALKELVTHRQLQRRICPLDHAKAPLARARTVVALETISSPLNTYLRFGAPAPATATLAWRCPANYAESLYRDLDPRHQELASTLYERILGPTHFMRYADGCLLFGHPGVPSGMPGAIASSGEQVAANVACFLATALASEQARQRLALWDILSSFSLINRVRLVNVLREIAMTSDISFVVIGAPSDSRGLAVRWFRAAFAPELVVDYDRHK